MTAHYYALFRQHMLFPPRAVMYFLVWVVVFILYQYDRAEKEESKGKVQRRRKNRTGGVEEEEEEAEVEEEWNEVRREDIQNLVLN